MKDSEENKNETALNNIFVVFEENLKKSEKKVKKSRDIWTEVFTIRWQRSGLSRPFIKKKEKSIYDRLDYDI